mgnify:CR=1 FL=1
MSVTNFEYNLYMNKYMLLVKSFPLSSFFELVIIRLHLENKVDLNNGLVILLKKMVLNF